MQKGQAESSKPFLSHRRWLGSLGDTAVPFLCLGPIWAIAQGKKAHIKATSIHGDNLLTKTWS